MLLELINKAIDLLLGNRKVVKDLKAELAVKDTTIADLHAQLDAEVLKESGLESAVTDAKAATATLQTQIDELNAKAADLTAAVNESPEVPEVTDLDLSV